MTKTGPIEKIFESYSAIADGRVSISDASASYWKNILASIKDGEGVSKR